MLELKKLRDLVQVTYLTETNAQKGYVICPELPVTKERVTNNKQGKKNPKKKSLFIKNIWKGKRIWFAQPISFTYYAFYRLKYDVMPGSSVAIL